MFSSGTEKAEKEKRVTVYKSYYSLVAQSVTELENGVSKTGAFHDQVGKHIILNSSSSKHLKFLNIRPESHNDFMQHCEDFSIQYS